MRRRSILAIALGCLSMGAGAALAHHGSRVSYDLSKTVTIKGVIKEWAYVNPHVYFIFEGKDESGKVTEYAVETDPPIMMERRYQWNRKYLKVGEEVTVTFWPAKLGAPRGFMHSLVTADGRKTDHSERPRE